MFKVTKNISDFKDESYLKIIVHVIKLITNVFLKIIFRYRKLNNSSENKKKN